jgi:hypothetical protein
VNSNTILITSITFDVSLESDQSPAPEQYDINENENQDDDSIIYLAETWFGHFDWWTHKQQTNPARRNCQSSEIDTVKGNLTYQAMSIVQIASNNFEEKLQTHADAAAGKF